MIQRYYESPIRVQSFHRFFFQFIKRFIFTDNDIKTILTF